MVKKRTFLDYAASTPIDKRVSSVMAKIEQTAWGNPSSLYREGEQSREILEKAREEVARLLNCRAGEIFFTGGGTESLNIAIQGVVKRSAKFPHIITSTIEHPAILEPIRNLIKEGKAEASFLNPDQHGIINPESVEKEMKENTVLIALGHANGEIGTLQPIQKIGNVIKKYRQTRPLDHSEPLLAYPYLLVDASQSAMYQNIFLERLGADLLVLDGLKMYGPRGAGILAVRHGVGISPITSGGGQEKGLRPGTENVVGAVGLAEALKISDKMRAPESSRLTKLRDYTIEKILKEIPGSSLNGHPKHRLPNNLNICFQTNNKENKIDSEFLVIKLDTYGLSVSSASACMNLKNENSSYVIEALGKPECASSSIRITLGRETKKADLDNIIKTLKQILK